MKYKHLEPEVDLNDPESGFSFSSNGDPVELFFVDWRNRKIIFKFYTTYVFTYRISENWMSLPEAQVLEILDSAQIATLRSDHSASADEELHHYIISTNEDEWCEIVAARYETEKEEKD